MAESLAKVDCSLCGRPDQAGYCVGCGFNFEAGRVSTFLRRAAELVQEEDLEGALVALGRACESEGANPFAWMRRGQVAERLWGGEGDPPARSAEARECFRRLIELSPLVLNHHMLFIGVSSKLGELAQAEAMYRHWAEERPDLAVFAQARDAAAAERRLRGSGTLLSARDEAGPGGRRDLFKIYILLGTISFILALMLLALWALEKKAGQPSVSNLILGLFFAFGGALGLGLAFAVRREGLSRL